jgi:hypothetical protein
MRCAIVLICKTPTMKYFCCLIAVFSFALCTAQAEEPIGIEAIQIKPEYPGGIKRFYEYIGKSFRTPVTKREEDITVRFVISFVVERDGSVSNVTLVEDVGYGLEQEAKRVFAACPEKWKPGFQNGKNVRAHYTLPVVLKIKGTPKTKAPAKETKKQ